MEYEGDEDLAATADSALIREDPWSMFKGYHKHHEQEAPGTIGEAVSFQHHRDRARPMLLNSDRSPAGRLKA
ncbi:hypothetical protein ARMSODRAFT_967593 [Armillaria solidipes]|uniref:Uncharacterized protein n=1 Tax=Armillaria solidipes TaxID=1076256 RepID=A0A2H3AXV3_9AGAR|nr:hypothetical protein ARMSODRAFT_967593 [Armillaria solidipes]